MTPQRKFDPRNVARALLGVLFCWAAVSKLANVPEFFGEVGAYQLPLPDGALRMVAVVLPWLELLCGLMLLGSFWLRAALSWCLLLFAVFAVATGQAWARGLDISCGCFNLQVVGLEVLAKFVETPAFAFTRAAVCLIVTFWLWRKAETAPEINHG